MVMDSLLSMLIFLLTLSSLNLASTSSSQPFYKEHCASTVPESPTTNLIFPHFFPLGSHHTGYFTGGDRIIDVDSTTWNRYTFHLQRWGMHATEAPGLFRIQGTVSFSGTNTFFYHDDERLTYGNGHHYHRNQVTFNLEGFWSGSSGKVCMVGTGSGYSKTGDFLDLDAVFKLDGVFNSSIINSLINGSLESSSSEKGDGNFEPFHVLMFPKGNYNYTLDSTEAENECSSGGDGEQGLSNNNSLSFCNYPLSRAIKRLWLEYSSDCNNSSKNCTPISGVSGNLPSLMTLRGIECSSSEKHRLRVLLRFMNNSYYEYNQGYNPKTMLVGEGWWDEKKNRLCVVACHVMSNASSNHVGDCSVRLRLRFPAIWSINSTSKIVGQIWSNKAANDSGYFKRITFRSQPLDGRVGVQGMEKYEYSLLDRVKKSCPTNNAVKHKGRMYPDAYSNDMRFDMSVREFNKSRAAWGYSAPISVNDHVYGSDWPTASDVIVHNEKLFNMSYKISIMLNSTLVDKNSLFNLSSQIAKISAEGIYDAGTGALCMVGCRDLVSHSGLPIVPSGDCEILVTFQFASVNAKSGSYINGRIESTRKNSSDPLYFNPLDLSSAAFYKEAAEKAVWRMDMEVTMVLISTTLACVWVGLQLYHVKRHPNVLPFISLTMMSILTLGYMIPLVLNLEALLSQNPNNKNFVFGNVGWLEVNEISIRLTTMVAFLLQFRLLQQTWSSRNANECNKGLWAAEKKAAYVTLPLYAAGLLIALLFKLKTSNYKQQQHHSSWENFKSYGGLVLDGFLLPQIILNLFSNMRDNVLSYAFYFGTTFVRLLPHAYDLYRIHNYARIDNGSYLYADPSADFYSTAWDIAIPLGGIVFAVIIYLQQRFGAHYILPRRFQGSKVYEKVPVVNESEAGGETTNM